MRIHTDKLTADDMFDALNLAKQHGLIMHGVAFDPIVAMNSKTHNRAYEIQLGAFEQVGLPANYVNRYGKRQKCRRVRNAANPTLRFSATWHEWGWFIAILYRKDPDARWGDRKRPDYANSGDFHSKTQGKFAGVLVNG
jgi:hypothetical protein